MKKNGKFINCKTCGKEFYISKSRFGKKKYCSKLCGIKNYGPAKRKCIICGKEFEIDSWLKIQKKTCSRECWYQNNKRISNKRCSEKIIKICKRCGCEYQGSRHYLVGKYCRKCQYEIFKESRLESKNPNYRNGKYTFKNFQNRKNITSFRHLNACSKYRRKFIKEHDYQFCEICGVNKNGTVRFEVHHIYSASSHPKHKELHNSKNLIHICKECHLKFHQGLYKDKFLQLEKERGLKKLFT
jgi:hypothetical protein